MSVIPRDVQERIAAGVWAEVRARKAAGRLSGPSGWREWLTGNFPAYVRAAFAQRHVDLWEWVWSIGADVRPRPFVALWPRGGGKSTSAELAAVALGLRGKRKYALYVCETQDQADKHVSTIGSLLETAGVERAVNKYGNSRGWRRNRLWTAGGFIVDALGLDTASRGIKVEEKRPDLIVLDDIDGRHDSKVMTEKKQATITDTVLPTGTGNLAVLAVQNLVHQDSIFDRLRRAIPPLLVDRIISGPFAALEGFEFVYDVTLERYRITAGRPTWEGQSVAECENAVNTWGLLPFKRESQHEVGDAEGSLWKRAEMIEAHRVTAAPELVRVVVAIDPSATSSTSSDECGIVAVGRGENDHGYVLADRSRRDTPSGWARAAVDLFVELKADRIVAEANNGGEMVSTVIGFVVREINAQREAAGLPSIAVSVELVYASRGKQTRAEPTSTLYSEARMHHVGVLGMLEDEMCNWVPGIGPSPNRVDALVWATTSIEIPSATGLIAW
jgi:hypothetical protein